MTSERLNNLLPEMPPMVSSTPVISVIMPVYNSIKYLDKAVNSILSQSFRDFEFLIFDDGSTDGSLKKLQQYANQDKRIQLFTQEHRGLTILLNEGLKKATGKYIARMDSDDIALLNRFETQLTFLAENPECVAVGSEILRIDPEGLPIGIKGQPTKHEEILQALLNGRGGIINHPSAMFPRSALEAIGGYRCDLEPAEDFDLFVRLSEIGTLANLPQVLIKYRLHSQRTTSLRRKIQLEKVREIVCQAWCKRGMGEPPRDLLKSQPVLSPRESRKQWAQTAISQGYFITGLKHFIILLINRPYSLTTWKMVLRSLKSSIKQRNLVNFVNSASR